MPSKPDRPSPVVALLFIVVKLLFELGFVSVFALTVARVKAQTLAFLIESPSETRSKISDHITIFRFISVTGLVCDVSEKGCQLPLAGFFLRAEIGDPQVSLVLSAEAWIARNS